MAVSITLTAHANRYGTHRLWESDGTTYGVGSAHTARHSWWLYRDGTLIDQNHTGPVFSHVFDDADDGVDFDLYYHVLEEGAGSPTEATLSWTHSVTGWDRTYYVDTSGSDSNDGLSTGAAKATLASAVSAAKSWWSGTQNVRILLNRGQTHSYAGSLDYPGPRQGRWGLGAYGTGAKPEITLTSDTDLINVGSGFSANHITIHCENIEVTGTASTNSAQVFFFNQFNSGTVPTMSSVVRDCDFSNVGGLVESGSPNGIPTAAVSMDGRGDLLAFHNCVLTSTHDYAIRFGGGWRPGYIHTEGCSSVTNPDAGSGSFIRSYDTQYWWMRDILVGDHAAPAMRLLSAGSSGTPATVNHNEWFNFSGIGTYDGQYTFQNTANEGSSPSDEINEQRDQWFHSLRCNSRDASAIAVTLCGVLNRISVRASWFYSTVVGVDNDPGAANNETCNDFYYQCNTVYIPSTSGGSTIGLSFTGYDSGSTASNWNVDNNFIAVVSASGNPSFGGAGSGLGDPLTSSDYNIVVMPSNSLVWYTGFTNGGVGLASWTSASGHDANSSESTGTINITTAGTLGTADDYDFHLTSGSTAIDAGAAVDGADIDYDGFLRVATHDAGATDLAATSAPSEPSSGVTGTSDMTLPVPTQSASGSLTYNGSGTPSLSVPTMSAAGKLTYSGIGTPSLPLVTMSAAGKLTYLGSGTPSLPLVTMSASGTAGTTGTSAMTLPLVTQSAVGKLTYNGSGTPSLSVPTMSASGTASSAGPTTGSSALTLLMPTMSATGAASHVATSTPSLLLPTMSASGKLGYAGTSAMTLPVPTLSSSGVAYTAITGTSTLSLPVPTMSASGNFGTIQLDTSGPGTETWRSSKFTATVNATKVYVYGYSAETDMATAVWTAGDVVEQSWFTIGSDTDDVTAVISLVSGSITSAVVYPGDAGVTQEIAAGDLTLTIPASAKNLRIEVNGDRSECLHIFVKPPKDDAGLTTTHPSLAVSISSVDISTDTITTAVPHGFSEGDRILIKSTGTRPALSGTELNAYEFVYAYNVTETTFQLSSVWPNTEGAEDIDDAGSGTLTVYPGTYTTTDSNLYFDAGEHILGRLFKPGDDVTIYLEAGAVVVGSFDLRGVQGVTITGPGMLAGTFSVYEDLLSLSQTARREYSMFFGWNGTNFNYTNQVKGITVAAQPYYLTFEGVWSWRHVTTIAPWKFEADGFKTSGYVGTNVSEVVNCFCFVGDDGCYFFHNFEIRTDSGNYVVTAANSCYHGGYFADTPLSASWSTTMTDCHATHLGIADSGTPGIYPSYGRSVIMACWVDGFEADSAKGRTNYTIDGLKVWGEFPGRLFTFGNFAYPYAAGDRDQAGQLYDWTISNVTTEYDMGQIALIVGRDGENTPHDLQFRNLTVKNTRVDVVNYDEYFDIDPEVYDLLWDNRGTSSASLPSLTATGVSLVVGTGSGSIPSLTAVGISSGVVGSASGSVPLVTATGVAGALTCSGGESLYPVIGAEQMYYVGPSGDSLLFGFRAPAPAIGVRDAGLANGSASVVAESVSGTSTLRLELYSIRVTATFGACLPGEAGPIEVSAASFNVAFRFRVTLFGDETLTEADLPAEIQFTNPMTGAGVVSIGPTGARPVRSRYDEARAEADYILNAATSVGGGVEVTRDVTLSTLEVTSEAPWGSWSAVDGYDGLTLTVDAQACANSAGATSNQGTENA